MRTCKLIVPDSLAKQEPHPTDRQGWRPFSSKEKRSGTILREDNKQDLPMHNSTVQFRPVGRLLIANRGEIAVRIHRTAKRMGLTTIGVVTQAEPETQADEAAWLQGDTLAATYLNADALVALALKYEADALHPGYGFLSENANFAAKVEAAGLLCVGPSPEAIRRMGDKVEARKTALELGLPLTASAEGNLEEVLSQRDRKSTRLNSSHVRISYA